MEEKHEEEQEAHAEEKENGVELGVEEEHEQQQQHQQQHQQQQKQLTPIPPPTPWPPASPVQMSLEAVQPQEGGGDDRQQRGWKSGRFAALDWCSASWWGLGSSKDVSASAVRFESVYGRKRRVGRGSGVRR